MGAHLVMAEEGGVAPDALLVQWVLNKAGNSDFRSFVATPLHYSSLKALCRLWLRRRTGAFHTPDFSPSLT
jgi:hypothetical protein